MTDEKTKTTPAERAQERLDAADRRIKRISDKLTGIKDQATVLENALKDAQKRREYLAQDPALPQQPDDETAAVEGLIGAVCPECRAGKHVNCTHVVPDDGDTVSPCACETAGHIAAS